jgi:crotonobetainyl-CoA:carnitine CoA-transferase CaiB-like acyl-CoA transferase
MSYHLLYRQFAGVNPHPQGTRHTAFAPYGSYPAADGAIMIGISGDKAFRRLCEALGAPEIANDPLFLTNPDRVRNTPELDRRLNRILREGTVSHWTAILDRYDIANDPVQNAEQVLDDRQTAALQQLERIELAGAESVFVPRLPIALSSTPPAIQGSPPQPGEHTRAILLEAGFPDHEIDELLHSGICAAGGER